MVRVLRLVGLCGLFLMLGLSPVQAQRPAPEAAVGSAFTYQGYLSDGGVPAEGVYDFRFVLYNADVGGAQVGAILTLDDVVVMEGRFTV